MKPYLLLLLFQISFTAVNAQGKFYRQYWATFDKGITGVGNRLRVNDPEISLHETFWSRAEVKANGLQLINIPETLPLLEKAELYAEMWGGHPGVINKRFSINGRSEYYFPKDGAEEVNCAYSYPVIPIKPQHLVNGMNAFQFTCDRGHTFWGHYIIDNIAVRCYLKADHPDIKSAGLTTFSAVPVADQKILGENARFHLRYTEGSEAQIEKVHYFARYTGYDDNGNLQEDDWHGYTYKKEFKNHAGSSDKAPFIVSWNTEMLPDQGKPLSVKALVELKNGLYYLTDELNGLTFAAARPKVQLYKCTVMPVPFWSRDNREKLAEIELPDDILKIEKAQLWVRIWDGGEGSIKDPFTLNGKPYSITSGKASHEVVFSIQDVDKQSLKPGKNTIRLISDTKEHGIEMLLPGPCLIVRYKQ